MGQALRALPGTDDSEPYREKEGKRPPPRYNATLSEELKDLIK